MKQFDGLEHRVEWPFSQFLSSEHLEQLEIDQVHAFADVVDQVLNSFSKQGVDDEGDDGGQREGTVLVFDPLIVVAKTSIRHFRFFFSRDNSYAASQLKQNSNLAFSRKQDVPINFLKFEIIY